MLPLGLTAAEQRVFHATLLTSHQIHVEASLMNLDGEVLRPLTVLDGQVDVDATGEVTRSATVDLLDPPRIGMDRMIRLVYGVRCPFGWVDVPVFTGRCTNVDDHGSVVSVEAQGKEEMASTPVFKPVTLPKGMRTDAAVRVLLGESTGENRFDLPDMPTRLQREVSVAREDAVWPVAKRLVRSTGRQLFYDGAGRCRARRMPDNPQWTFRDDDRASVLSVPTRPTSLEGVVNVVLVRGGTPKGAKHPVKVRVDAPAGHPLSARHMGRNETPRFLPAIVERDNILTDADARQVGRRTLRDGLRRSVDASFDASPIPHLEENDLVRVATDDFTATMRLQRFTLPLRPAAMSVGTHKVTRR